MNEIDWSKAPAGATHWEPNNEYANQGWMKLKNGRWSFMDSRGNWREHSSDMEAGRLAVMIPRPVEPAGWDGNGLPPVGTVCEVNARLICAAPELLEVLRDVSQALARLYAGECRGFSEGLLEPGAALEKARAAIAKATGQADDSLDTA